MLGSSRCSDNAQELRLGKDKTLDRERGKISHVLPHRAASSSTEFHQYALLLPGSLDRLTLPKDPWTVNSLPKALARRTSSAWLGSFVDSNGVKPRQNAGVRLTGALQWHLEPNYTDIAAQRPDDQSTKLVEALCTSLRRR